MTKPNEQVPEEPDAFDELVAPDEQDEQEDEEGEEGEEEETPGPTHKGDLFFNPEEWEALDAAARNRNARKEWGTLRSRLEERIVGSDELLDSLALLGVSHRSGRGQRALLTGPTGSGKSWSATALSYSLDSPILVLPANELTEPGWGSGSHLADHLLSWKQLHKSRVVHGIIVLDEIDKLAAREGTHPSNQEKYLKMQASLLSLLGRSPVLVGDNTELRTQLITVICCGAFSEAEFSQEGRTPTSEELIAYGLIPELVDRLEERIVLPPMSTDSMVEVFRRAVGGRATATHMLAIEMGYEVHVPDETYRYVAQRVVAGHAGTGPRAARAWIEAAAKRVLLRALRDEAEPGTQLIVSPDDIQVPAARSFRRRNGW